MKEDLETVVKMQVVEAEKHNRLRAALLGGCSALGVLTIVSILVFGRCAVELCRIRRGQEAERDRESRFRRDARKGSVRQEVQNMKKGAVVVSSIGEVTARGNVKKTSGDENRIEVVYDLPCESGIANPFSDFELCVEEGSTTLQRMREMTRREVMEYDAERVARNGDIVRARGGRQSGGNEGALHPKVGRVKKRVGARAGAALQRLLRGGNK